MSFVAAALEPAEKSAHSRPAILVELAMLALVALDHGFGGTRLALDQPVALFALVISRKETAVRIFRLRASLIIHSLIS